MTETTHPTDEGATFYLTQWTRRAYPEIPTWDATIDEDNTGFTLLESLTEEQLKLHIRRALWMGLKKPSLKGAMAEYAHVLGMATELETRFGQTPRLPELWEWLDSFPLTPRDREFMQKLDAGEVGEIGSDDAEGDER